MQVLKTDPNVTENKFHVTYHAAAVPDQAEAAQLKLQTLLDSFQ